MSTNNNDNSNSSNNSSNRNNHNGNNRNKNNSSSNSNNNNNPYLTWKYLICWGANPAVLLSLCESEQCKFNLCPIYGKGLESLCKQRAGGFGETLFRLNSNKALPEIRLRLTWGVMGNCDPTITIVRIKGV